MTILKNTVRDLLSTASLILLVKNWRETLRAIRQSQGDYPPLNFRCGMTIEGAAHERPFQWFGPVFRDREYRRYIEEPAAGVVIDIGANIGAATLDWLSRKPRLTVHAYEPDPSTFDVLTRNINFNRYANRTQLFNEAVGGRCGTSQFYRVGASTMTTAFPGGREPREAFNVQHVDLNRVVQRCGDTLPIGLVKMDAEGAEAEILEAAQSPTLRNIHQFIIECHDRFVPGAQARCTEVLQRNGFRCIACPTDDEFSLLYALAASR